MSYTTFFFDSFSWEGQTLSLRYSLDDEEHFTETWTFPFAEKFENLSPEKQQVLLRASEGLWLMAGVSYYKAGVQNELKIKNEKLKMGKEQAAFFEKTYLNGLGEFFYTNNIEPPKIQFPFSESDEGREKIPLNLSGTLIPLGGGKDSLVTIEILKSLLSSPDSLFPPDSRFSTPDYTSTLPLSTWTAAQYDFFDPLIKKTGLPHLSLQRKVCPNLIKLNTQGAPNGHVPISAIWAFASVISAILSGHKYIAFSNEASANVGSTHIGDLEINHQYSKSLTFEQDFQDYVQNFITPEVHYFSFLRPLTELHIAQIFCTKVFEKYEGFFSSCNRNFHFMKEKKNDSGRFFWCQKCAKCSFILCLFAAFLSREKLESIFGKNPFQNPKLSAYLPELLGEKNLKPFECVGEADEVRQALQMAHQTGEYPELAPYLRSTQKAVGSRGKDNLKALHKHTMPKHFFNILKESLL